MPNIPTDSCDATTITRGRETFLSFGGGNYLGLAHHPRVVQAVQNAASIYGLSSSASRETTGNARSHAELEQRLTSFCRHQAGLLVPDGYTANLAALQGFEQMGIKHALIDARGHASLKDAARLAGMQITLYHHLDAGHAAHCIQSLDSACVVLTDSVFTTDGDLAPAHELAGALRSCDWLLLDDCHGFAVLGDHGRGTPDELGLVSNQLVVTTTLAKGLGCAGGIVMGASDPVEAARKHSVAYRCTTPASPAIVAGGLEALRILEEDDRIHARLTENIEHTQQTLRSLGIEAHRHKSAIFAFVLGDLQEMQFIEETLLRQGVLLPLMAYPNGPAPDYFRLVVNASHTHEQIDQLGSAMRLATRQAVEQHKEARA
ncbi:MAG: aminotransferase class I/II-fold pyridoxal phosphate-dependent enzyme [Phycisphaerales bacterium JB047]